MGTQELKAEELSGQASGLRQFRGAGKQRELPK
jgi:hypothetical protein